MTTAYLGFDTFTQSSKTMSVRAVVLWVSTKYVELCIYPMPRLARAGGLGETEAAENGADRGSDTSPEPW